MGRAVKDERDALCVESLVVWSRKGYPALERFSRAIIILSFFSQGELTRRCAYTLGLQS